MVPDSRSTVAGSRACARVPTSCAHPRRFARNFRTPENHAMSAYDFFASKKRVNVLKKVKVRGEPVRDAVMAGARRRLRPVLMTASVASLGFIPMALSTSTGLRYSDPSLRWSSEVCSRPPRLRSSCFLCCTNGRLGRRLNPRSPETLERSKNIVERGLLESDSVRAIRQHCHFA